MNPQHVTTLHDFAAEFVTSGTYHLMRGEYAYGGTAIMATTDDDEPAFVVSVYLEGQTLPDGEFWAKDWSENGGIVEELTARGIIELTGAQVPTGFVIARSARLAEAYR